MCESELYGELKWVQLGQDIWTVEKPFRFLGAPVGTRMTIMRLSSRKLVVHSAFDPGEELRRKLDSLGEVSFVVCPNRMHHVLVGDLLQHYPKAQLYLSTVLPSKRPDLNYGKVLGDVGPADWLPDLEHHSLRGHLFLDELVFFHRPSRTLILTDLLWGCRKSYPWYLRWLTSLGDKGSGLVPPPEMRYMFRPRQTALYSLRTILEWDIERIVTSHGPLVHEGGREVFRKAFAFLLD